MKEKTKLPLISADPPAKAFWTVDGRIFHNLPEMRRALDEMSGETYVYHANREKNDFAAWVREVARDEKLAAELMKAKTRSAAFRAVADRLKDYAL